MILNREQLLAPGFFKLCLLTVKTKFSPQIIKSRQFLQKNNTIWQHACLLPDPCVTCPPIMSAARYWVTWRAHGGGSADGGVQAV